MSRAAKADKDLNTSELVDREQPLKAAASQMTDNLAKSGEQPDKVVGIKSGDTLSALAKKYGTTVKALMAANPDIKDANKIKAGAKLNIAQKATPPKVEEETFGESQDGYKSGGSLRRASGGGLGCGIAKRGFGAVRSK